jgi:hypothetical protein
MIVCSYSAVKLVNNHGAVLFTMSLKVQIIQKSTVFFVVNVLLNNYIHRKKQI